MVNDDATPAATDTPLYHGCRAALGPGARVNREGEAAYFSSKLDAAIWAAELADGEGAPRVYRVATSGPVEDVTKDADYQPAPHPAMTWRTRAPLEILSEMKQWEYYHGTRVSLREGDTIEPGHAANFGPAPRTANYVYFTRTLDAAIWGAELAAGEGQGRIYRVEPTGEIENDPNLTNARFKGNPTQSFRSRAPLRVIGELLQWEGHPPALVRAMKEGLARLDKAGVTPDD